MKRHFYLTVVILYFFQLVYAQETMYNNDSTFIELKTGEKIFGKVEYKSPFIGSDYFLFNDSIKYKKKEVSNYQNDEGYFVNVKVGFIFTKEVFAKRITRGKIDLFSYEYIGFNPGYTHTFNHPMGTATHVHPSSIEKGAIHFFSKDKKNILEVDYGNLREHIKDNIESIGYLDDFQTITYTQIGLGVGGIGLIGLGLANIKEGDYDIRSTIIIGGIMANVAWILQLFKPPLLQKAVKVYNK